MSAKLVLYGVDVSPPVRAVQLTLDALKLDYTFKELNMKDKEHLSPEYMKKNPEHTLPLLEDNGKYLVDSHAIMGYLVHKYAKDDLLYPKEPYQRAIVDHRLHYETGVMFAGCLRPAFLPLAMGSMTKEKFTEVLKQMNDIYGILEVFLNDNAYIAGKQLTIADFSIAATLASMQLIEPIDGKKYPKLTAWLERLKKLPKFVEINEKPPPKVLPMIAGSMAKLRE